MKALITGASGFVGKNLKRRLLELGWQVDLLTREQLEDFKFIKGEYDYIFHLAAYGQMIDQRDDVWEIYQTNVIKLLNLLRRTNNIKYKALINIGTSSEYGIKNKPMKETDLLEPDMFYSASKAAGTLLCRVWAKEMNKPVVTVRPFSLYGYGEADFRFIPKLMKCFAFGEKFKLADGMHDWIYIDDFIDALLIVAKNAKKLKGKVVNVGSGVMTSNKDIVKIVQKMINKPLNMERVKMRSYDTKNKWVADISLIKSFGWKPKTSLKEGLENIASYYLPW